jgi:glycerol uptake facilitator-like aquaporin
VTVPRKLVAEGLGTALVAAVVGSGIMAQHLARDPPRRSCETRAAYIAAASWFTASTSFANPAVTIARAFTDTCAGILPADAGGFIAAQAAGAALGGRLFTGLVPLAPRAT